MYIEQNELTESEELFMDKKKMFGRSSGLYTLTALARYKDASSILEGAEAVKAQNGEEVRALSPPSLEKLALKSTPLKIISLMDVQMYAISYH